MFERIKDIATGIVVFVAVFGVIAAFVLHCAALSGAYR